MDRAAWLSGPSDGRACTGQGRVYAADLDADRGWLAIAHHQDEGAAGSGSCRAARDSGMRPVNLGPLPTPALMHYAVGTGKGSVMVTGSHIPFDHNGYKLNTARGELLKHHEEPVNRTVQRVREEIYGQPFRDSLFDPCGRFREGHRELLPVDPRGRLAYLERYADFFEGASLAGKRILVYQHSAVGRDLMVEILRTFQAEVIPAGRSEQFVPIDTENIDAAQLAVIQALADSAAAQYGPLDAVVSTDGDSDRPLILGVDGGRVRFFSGDLVGMIVAEYLGAASVVVPVSCNDAIDRGSLARVTEPKTRIGDRAIANGAITDSCPNHVGSGSDVQRDWTEQSGINAVVDESGRCSVDQRNRSEGRQFGKVARQHRRSRHEGLSIHRVRTSRCALIPAKEE